MAENRLAAVSGMATGRKRKSEGKWEETAHTENERSLYMTLKQQLGKLKCKNFLFLTIAGMVNAFGVTMFIAPVDLYDSGISGTSILLSQLTPEWLSLSFF